MAVEVNTSQFEDVVVKSPKPVVVDMYAPWCGPCRMMAPIFEELSGELTQYTFVKLNIDEERDIAIRYSVSSIPTLLFFKNGNVVGRETGYISKDGLKEKIETYCK